MSRFLENILLGHEKHSVQLCKNQYEVDKFVADKRSSIAMKQLRTVLRRPAVLAAIFGAGAIKEITTDDDSEKSGSSTSLMQYVMFASRFI